MFINVSLLTICSPQSLREHQTLYCSIDCSDMLFNSPKSFLCEFKPTWSCYYFPKPFNHSSAFISGPLITSAVDAGFLHNMLLWAIGSLGSHYNTFPPELSGTNSARHFLIFPPLPSTPPIKSNMSLNCLYVCVGGHVKCLHNTLLYKS